MNELSMLQRSLLERLNAGEIVIGDGGMIFNLERRGYVHAGHYTPEVVIEHPDAGNSYFIVISFSFSFCFVRFLSFFHFSIISFLLHFHFIFVSFLFDFCCIAISVSFHLLFIFSSFLFHFQFIVILFSIHYQFIVILFSIHYQFIFISFQFPYSMHVDFIVIVL